MTTQHNLNRISKTTSLLVADSRSNSSTQSPWFSNIWKYLTQWFLQSNEPRVWQEHDRFGQTRYCIYDPYTQRSLYCSTEDETRVCLEQLLYR